MEAKLVTEQLSIETTCRYDIEPPTSQLRILIADDDPYIRQLLELALGDNGYAVTSASDGHELVRLAQDRVPSLILVDLAMPRMDGYEAIRQLRNDTRTAHVPMLILTARTDAKDIVTGFETGADDYIAKPFDISELLARVKSHLRRSAQRPVLNPLTGLPGGILLAQAIRQRLARKTPFALLYADLDNFKAFNDIYGFSRGDQAILFVASIIQRVLTAHGNADDSIGHIGGDDFAMLTTPDRADTICRALISTFDEEVLRLYDPEDRQRGYISGTDRYGILRRFGLMSISIGVVTSHRRDFIDQEALTRVAAEMKHHAKEQPGSTFAIDQRTSLQSSEIERRRTRNRALLILSDDSSLRAIVGSAFRDGGYYVREVKQVNDAQLMIDAPKRAALVLADAQLGSALWEFCIEQASGKSSPPIVVLAYDTQDIAKARSAGVAACLQLPLPLVDIVACVDQLIGNGDTDYEARAVNST